MDFVATEMANFNEIETMNWHHLVIGVQIDNMSALNSSCELFMIPHLSLLSVFIFIFPVSYVFYSYS